MRLINLSSFYLFRTPGRPHLPLSEDDDDDHDGAAEEANCISSSPPPSPSSIDPQGQTKGVSKGEHQPPAAPSGGRHGNQEQTQKQQVSNKV